MTSKFEDTYVMRLMSLQHVKDETDVQRQKRILNGARLHIGYFNSVEGAAEARKRAQELHFGKFAGPCLTAKI